MPKSGELWVPGFFDDSTLLGSFAELAAPLVGGADWPTLADYTALGERERRERAPHLPPVRFTPMRKRPRRAARDAPIDPSTLYDGSIALLGEIPCLQASYHDLFNALAWAAFPRSKRALHSRQYQAQRRLVAPGHSRLPNRRTREQDALALLDEGGALLLETASAASRAGPASLPTLLKESELPAGSHLLLFGHALMQHVAFEQTAVHAATLRVTVGTTVRARLDLIDEADRALERHLLAPDTLLRPDFAHTVTIEPKAQDRSGRALQSASCEHANAAP